MGRSIVVVFAGFVIMAAIVMMGTMALVAALVPGGLAGMRAKMQSGDKSMPTPSTNYLIGNIVLSFIAAIIGGYVTALKTTHDVNYHIFALAAVVLVMGVLSGMSQNSTGQPGWYKYAIPLVGVAGVCVNLLLFT